MVAVSVDVKGCVVWFVEWFDCSIVKVKGYIEVVYNFFVSIYCNFEFVV